MASAWPTAAHYRAAARDGLAAGVSPWLQEQVAFLSFPSHGALHKGWPRLHLEVSAQPLESG